MQKLRRFANVAIVSFFLFGCGGGGGGGDDKAKFPTPTLPAKATKIDASNAEEIANSALDSIEGLVEFAPKSEGPPSISQTIRLVTDQVTKRNRNSATEIAGKKDDLSWLFCFSGTAIDRYDETENSISGTLKFSDCDIGFGIILNGSFPYEGSWNDTTLDYNFKFGGQLDFDDGFEVVKIVMKFVETGNDGTGDFSLSPSFSLEGIPDESYLLTTVEPIKGNYFTSETTSGELRVEGADNTRLCLEVTAINTFTVEFDDGLGGGCVPLVPPLVIVV